MHWTLRVGVFLLHVGWIAFFLHPDPVSVLLQKRGSPDEEVQFSEFCIAPPSVQKPVKPSAKTTSQWKDLPCCSNYSSEILNFSSVTGFIHQKTSELCAIEAVIFLTTDGEEVCTDPHAPWILDYVTRLSIQLFVAFQKETGSGGSDHRPNDQVQEVNQTEKLNPYQPPTPGPDTDIKDQDISSSPNLEVSQFTTAADTIIQSRVHRRGDPSTVRSCCLSYSKVRIPLHLFVGYTVQSTRECPINAVIFYTAHRRMICVDPNDKRLQEKIRQFQKKLKPIAT